MVLWYLFFLLVDNSSVLDISWRPLCKPDVCLYFSLNVSVYPVTSATFTALGTFWNFFLSYNVC